MVDDPPQDTVVEVVGDGVHSRDLILKSSVVINKLDKAISCSSCISKNDNYLKWREISILYSWSLMSSLLDLSELLRSI